MKKCAAKKLIGLLFLVMLLLCGCSAGQEGQGDGQETQSGGSPDAEVKEGYHAFDAEVKNVGIYMDSPVEFRALKITPDVLGWFDAWYRDPSAQKLELCGTEHLAIPFITWEPKDVSLQEIADGLHDEYIAGYLGTILEACPDNDVLIRFAHEMELGPDDGEAWYSWQDQEPQTYVAAWRHVVALGREINPNVRWVWSPNHANAYSEPYYPGDDYVDFVGITLNLPANRARFYSDFLEYYTLYGEKEQLERYGKKIVLSEVAYSEDEYGRRVKYIRSVFDAYAQMPDVSLVAFFNYDVSETQQYRIADDAPCMNSFYAGMNAVHGA